MPSLHEIVFPKKTGAALKAAAPFVNEVYADEYPAAGAPPAGVRSKPVLKIGHMTLHSMPKDKWYLRRLLLLLAFWLGWLFFNPLEQKVLTIIAATAYSFIEFAFTAVERRKPYTSIAQFGANLLYVPVLLHGYHALFSHNVFLFIGLFPLNVWLLEVVEEWLILRPLFGYNVAWCYKDYADEYLQGCIRMGHGVAWWGLGAVLWWVYPILCEVSSGLAVKLRSM